MSVSAAVIRKMDKIKAAAIAEYKLAHPTCATHAADWCLTLSTDQKTVTIHHRHYFMGKVSI